MAAHDRLDSLGSLSSVVERNGADVVVENVGLDNFVEAERTNWPEIAVNGSACATSVGPGISSVVRKRGVSVLKESDGNYYSVSECRLKRIRQEN